LHPALITPRQLISELTSAKIPSGMELPLDTTYKNSFQYIDLCKINAVFVYDTLIFAIKIPLVTEQTFNLYHVLPFPFQSTYSTRIYHYIEPSTPYFAINTVYTKYVNFKNMDSCIEIQNSEHICKTTILMQTQHQPSCETFLITATSDSIIPEQCNKGTIKTEIEIWYPLHDGTWLFILSQNSTIAIECDTLPYQKGIILPSTGILRLNANCRGYTYNTLLYSPSNYTNSYTHIIPSLKDLEPFPQIIDIQFSNLEIQPKKLKSLNLEELKILSSHLQQIDDVLQIHLTEKPFFHSTNLKNIIYFFIIILILYTIYKVKEYFCTKLQNRTSLPLQDIPNHSSPRHQFLCWKTKQRTSEIELNDVSINQHSHTSEDSSFSVSSSSHNLRPRPTPKPKTRD